MTAIITRQRAQQVHDLARARAGLVYDYGAAFTLDPRDSTDCSGLVLQTGAWFMGRTDWPSNRYGSTESFRRDDPIVYELGFRRLPAGGIAALGFTPVMLVGLHHGGGGVNSHTSCTLMTMDIPGGPVKVSTRGVDWESHGNRNGRNGHGVDLYDGARAWNDPMFEDHWYLDAKLEDAPNSPGIPDSSAVDILARALAPAVDKGRLAELLPAVSRCLVECGCTNTDRIAMWAAQIGHESAGLRHMEEIASGAAYEGRIELGNVQPGDGVRFKGRGPVQVTGRHNYTELSKWAYGKGLVPSLTFFVDHPEQLASDEYGFIGVTWYWTTQQPRLNQFADARNIEDASKAINAPGWIGTARRANGIAERITRYNTALAVGDDLLAIITAPSDDPIEELLMAEPVDSLSIYATRGEAKIPPIDMLRAIDAAVHKALVVEHDAELGDPDALFRMLRTARGEGKYTSPAAINLARNALAKLAGQAATVIEYIATAAGSGDTVAGDVLTTIEASNPAALQAFLASRKGA